MDSMKYKDFNRVPPKPPPRAKTYEYCPKKPEPEPTPGKFCRVPLKKHPSAHTLKYKMLNICPRIDYRQLQCQPIVICDDTNECKAKPRLRKVIKIDDDDSWLKPIPRPPKCPDLIVNPCANDVDEYNLPPCKLPNPEYSCGKYGDD